MVVAPSLSASTSVFISRPRELLHSNLGCTKTSSNCSMIKVNCQEGQQKLPSIQMPTRRTVTLGLWTTAMASSILSKDAFAADITQRFQRGEFLSNIKKKLYVAIKGNPDIVPDLLRLALNDAATYDKDSKSGGPNGSIRFSAELERPENKGLQSTVAFLEDVKKDIDAESKGGPLGWADLIHLAGQSAVKKTFLDAAIQKCGGNEDKGNQLFNAYGSNGQWGFFERQFGRADAQEADPEGRILLWEQATPSEIKERFGKLGLKARQVAVLSAFLGRNQDVTEAKLATDPEIAPWVDKYQRSRETVSQTDYEVDLIGAFTKLSTMGQNINYEAYTYAPKRLVLKL